VTKHDNSATQSIIYGSAEINTVTQSRVLSSPGYMVKQRGLEQSNQKDLTLKGTNTKEEKQSPRAEQQAQHSSTAECFLVGVSDWLTASWTSGYFDGSAAVSTDRSCGDLVERNYHVFSNRHVVLNRPLRRPHPSASFWGPASSLKARTVVVVARSATRPLTGDNCAVGAHCRELRRLNRHGRSEDFSSDGK